MFQILSIFGFHHVLCAVEDLLRGHPAVLVCDLLEARDLESLTGFDGADEICGIQHAVMGSGIEPGVTALEEFHMELSCLEIGVVDAGDAFTIGFLHDIGKILLNIVDTMLYQKVRTSVKNGMDIIEAENEMFETNHADMGFLLAKKWKLSVLLANCIKYHHDPLSSSMPQVSTLAYIANKISHDEPDVFDEALVKEQLGLDVSTVMQYRDQIEEKTNVLFASLNAG